MENPKEILSYATPRPEVVAGRRTVATLWFLMSRMTWIHWICMGIFQGLLTLLFLFLSTDGGGAVSIILVVGWIAIILGLTGLMRAKKALAPGVFLLDIYLLMCWLMFSEQILGYLKDPEYLFRNIWNDLDSVTSWYFAVLMVMQVGASIHALILTILLKWHPEWDPQEAEREALLASCQ